MIQRWDFDGQLSLENEVAFTVHFKGYNDPGCMYLRNGDPGHPPEGEDERVITDITWFGVKVKFDDLMRVCPKLAQALQDWVDEQDFPSEESLQ